MFLMIPLVTAGASAQALDLEQVTTYSTDASKTYVSSLTCGSTTNASGCFGFATLGPFRQACAIVATPVWSKSEPNGSTTYSRRVAVMARGARTGERASLWIYLESNNVTANYITPETKLVKAVPLPITGGPTASCFMARNASGFYVGTNQSPDAVRVAPDFTVATVGGFFPPIPVAGITSTADGHVAVTYKSGAADGFYVYRNNGSLVEDGGGASFMVGAGNAVQIGPNANAYPLAATSKPAAVEATPPLQDAARLPLGGQGNAAVRDGSGTVIFGGGKSFTHPPATQPAR